MPRKPYIVPFDYVEGAVEGQVPKVQRRIDALTRAFDAVTPPSSSDRMRMVALAWFLESPVLLYALGHNGPAIMELHSWLERFALREIPTRLGRDPAARGEIATLVARKTLGECADMLGRLGLWTDSDITFVRRLKKIRDAVSHKNFGLLAKALGVTTPHSHSDLSKHLADVDCAELIIGTMTLIQKVTVRRRPGGRNARTTARETPSR